MLKTLSEVVSNSIKAYERTFTFGREIWIWKKNLNDVSLACITHFKGLLRRENPKPIRV